MLATPPGSYPHAAMRHEHEVLLAALRAHPPRSGTWSIFGFDVDYALGVASERLAAIDDPSERVRARATLEISRRYDEAVRAATSYADLAEPMAWREALMVDHVAYELAQRRAPVRAALCGHNLHVGRAEEPVAIAGGVGPGGGRVPPLGAALAQAGHDPVVVWMLHASGADSGPPPGTGRVDAPAGTLNRALAGVGSAFAVATADVRELARPWRVATIYDTVIECVPADRCDLIVFLEHTSSLRSA